MKEWLLRVIFSLKTAPPGKLLFGANFRVMLVSARELEGFEMLDVSQGEESLPAHNLHDENSKTVTVYTRHKPGCANKGNPYWRRCRCTKYLYIYKNGASRQISARTRSWEKAEQKAQKIRESFELAKQSPRELRSQPPAHIGVEIRDAAEDFLKEIARLKLPARYRSRFDRV